MSNLRSIYGETLIELAANDDKIAVLEADLSKSTMGALFKAVYPERFYEFGIAEANMCSVAAGMAIAGKTPFIASFAVFVTGRCYDQIRTSVCIGDLNVKICGSSAGISDCGDGPTHQSIDDVSLMRTLPNMQVFVPCDGAEEKAILRFMAANPGPMYIRVSRVEAKDIHDGSYVFVPGKTEVVRTGSDAVIFASGPMVERALAAGDILASFGISLRVINVPSIKPLSAESVIENIGGLPVVFTAEEHSIYGGLGSAIAELAGRPVYRFGMPDRFGASAESYQALCEGLHLTARDLADYIQSNL